MSLRSVVFLFFWVGFGCLILWGGLSLLQDYREYRQFALDMDFYAHRLDELQTRLAERRKVL